MNKLPFFQFLYPNITTNAENKGYVITKHV